MDALEFIKERDRMCRFYHHAEDCYQCPAKDCECSAMEGMIDDDNIVTIVEEWAAAHPRKTRQSVFLEQYPETQLDIDGVLRVCPAIISPAHRGDAGMCADLSKLCANCRREFLMQEVDGL